MKKRLKWWFTLLLLPTAGALAGERVDFIWPTPSTAWNDNRSPADFLQHAGSGDPESGGFGGVRSGGHQFHEGIDIRPAARDRRGEPSDSVFAAMSGVVRHISRSAGDSSYGRYIVLEHPDQTPAIYTLYAHLSQMAPGLREGDQVKRGQVLATMGHSSGGYVIPRDRAHLHFEIGVMVTRDFQRWYNARKFGSTNEHGVWNGMNLMGIDPLDFLKEWRARRVNTFQEYFAKMEPEVRVRIATQRIPDFIQRYPALLTKPMPAIVAGWEIKFNWTGLPYAWTPLNSLEAAGLARNQPMLSEVNVALGKRERSKSIAVSRRSSWEPGKDLRTVLQQLFGLQ